MIRNDIKMKNKYGIMFDGASFGPKKTHTLNLNEMAKSMINPVIVRNTLLDTGHLNTANKLREKPYALSNLITRHIQIATGQMIRFKYRKRKDVSK